MARSWFGWLLLAAAALPAQAGDACANFKWDVAAERALFAGEARPLAVGAAAATAPGIEPGQLYQLTLIEQSQLAFAAPPGKKMLADGAAAGLVRFRVGEAGAYRISLDRGAWIDVVTAGQPLPSADFSGAPGCEAPRKIVLYQLPADTELLLQISGAPELRLRVAVSAVP